jgi:hypothetical protein
LEKCPGGKVSSPEIRGDSGKYLGEIIHKIQFTGCILACTYKIPSRGLREILGVPQKSRNFGKF